METKQLIVNLPEGFSVLETSTKEGQVVINLIKDLFIDIEPDVVYTYIDGIGNKTMFMSANNRITIGKPFKCSMTLEFGEDCDGNETYNITPDNCISFKRDWTICKAHEEEETRFFNLIKSQAGLVWDGYINAFKPKYPSRWADLGIIKGIQINNHSQLIGLNSYRSDNSNKATYPTVESANSFGILAAQLIQLRDVYNDYKSVTWEIGSMHYCIRPSIDDDKLIIIKDTCRSFPHFLTFHSEKQRDLFYNNFKDMILEFYKGIL